MALRRRILRYLQYGPATPAEISGALDIPIFAFAGWFLIVVGAVDALEGLIAVARQRYYLFGKRSIECDPIAPMNWGLIISSSSLT